MRNTLAYRYLTASDSAAFSRKVTEALANGWSLYGDPACTFDAKMDVMRYGQAVVKEIDAYDPAMDLDGL